MALRVAGVAVLMLVALAPSASGAGPTQQIAFTSARGCSSGTDLFVMGDDGSNVRRLTDTCLESEPSWSPDGSGLVFASLRDGTRSELYTTSADGSGLRQVTDQSQVAERPAWSRQDVIAFDSVSGIWTIRPDGSGLTRIATSGRDPSWSPDGARIAYTRPDVAGTAHVAIMGANGSDSRDVAQGSTPAFSPDGTRLAWSAHDANGAELVVANADGSSPHAVATIPNGQVYSYDLYPSWSPDSARIAFERGPNEELYVVPAAGGTPTRLTTFAGLDADAAWRPAVPSSGLVIARIRFAQRACSTRPGRATVLVTDAQGRPLTGAKVTVSRVHRAMPHRRGFFTVSASLAGRPTAVKRVSLPACR